MSRRGARDVPFTGVRAIRVCAFHAREIRTSQCVRDLRSKIVERTVHEAAAMTTLGQVISVLFTKFERQLHDEQLAAVATQVALDELLRGRQKTGKRKQ
jgi:hypothetical protein